MRNLLAAVILIAALVWTASAQQPVFRSRVELVTVDVTVVDADGEPIRDLTADRSRSPSTVAAPCGVGGVRLSSFEAARTVDGPRSLHVQRRGESRPARADCRRSEPTSGGSKGSRHCAPPRHSSMRSTPPIAWRRSRSTTAAPINFTTEHADREAALATAHR